MCRNIIFVLVDFILIFRVYSEVKDVIWMMTLNRI
jgi:hypothetical protein